MERQPRGAAIQKNQEGLRLLQVGDYEGAVTLFSEAIEIWPDYGAAYLNRSEAYRKLGKIAAANADRGQADSLVGGTTPEASQRHVELGHERMDRLAMRQLRYQDELTEARWGMWGSEAVIGLGLGLLILGFRLYFVKPYFVGTYPYRGWAWLTWIVGIVLCIAGYAYYSRYREKRRSILTEIERQM